MLMIEKETGRYVDWKIFDTNTNILSKENSEFTDKIFSKSKICIVIENEDGEIFGCYINSTINKVGCFIRDEHAFVFNLESNGRHPTPIKFNIKKEECDCAFCIYSDDYFIELFYCGNADILIKKENKKSESFCYQWEKSHFDYRGVEKALIQNPYNVWNGKDFTPKRFIVIQMK